MSSGNLTADRRFEYGRMLREIGDPAGAADVIAQALELAPTWAEGRFALAEALADANRKDEAIAAYRDYLRIEPADSMGAGIRLGLLIPALAPATLPEAYVRRLFDDYASRFDKALVEGLAYRAPEFLRAAVDRLSPGRIYRAVLDLGCGTGLAGTCFRPMAAWLEGVDLSARMVEEARRKAFYDQLAVNDLNTHLAQATRSFDLVIAADVLVYFGALEDIFLGARAKIADDGVFAFTVQRTDGGDFILGREHRYSHSRAYIARCAKQARFDPTVLTEGVFRQEKGADVPGLLILLQPV